MALRGGDPFHRPFTGLKSGQLAWWETPLCWPGGEDLRPPVKLYM